MKTLVELYDNETIKNIYGLLGFKPEELVLMCDKAEYESIRVQIRIMRHALKHLGIEVKISEYLVDTSCYKCIYEVCQQIIDEHEDVFFDLTGGKELMLIYAGAFCKENFVPSFYCDISNDEFVEVFNCQDQLALFKKPQLKVEDILRCYGAKLERSDHICVDVNDKEMVKDVLSFVSLAKSASEGWRQNIRYIQSLSQENESIYEDVLIYKGAKHKRVNNKYNVSCDERQMKVLESKGFIKNLTIGDGKVCFEFKNDLIKQMLKIEGLWLEFYIYYLAKRSKKYDDVVMSGVIDWNDLSQNENDPRNEIDIIVSKGVSANFISCKIGKIDTSYLFEIKLLSKLFGGEMGRACLVTLKSNITDKVKIRAKELGVKLISINS